MRSSDYLLSSDSLKIFILTWQTSYRSYFNKLIANNLSSLSFFFLVEKTKKVKRDVIWRAVTLQYCSSGGTIINQCYQNFPRSKLNPSEDLCYPPSLSSDLYLICFLF